jgi:TonB family protein
MRIAIVATLALFPVLLHAQANSPAQPQAASNSALESKLVEPKAISGSEINTATNGSVRISTGVVSPKLIHTVDVSAEEGSAWKVFGGDQTVVVALVVEPTGKPADLKIVQSADPVLDRNVLEAVSQYRFKPGTVSNQPTAIPVTLQVVVKHSK